MKAICLFLALAISAVLGLALQQRFLNQLRKKHAQTWEALGRPTLFRNNSITNSLAVLRLLWRQEYRALGDEQLVRLGGFLRLYLAGYFLLFVCVVILLITAKGYEN